MRHFIFLALFLLGCSMPSGQHTPDSQHADASTEKGTESTVKEFLETTCYQIFRCRSSIPPDQSFGPNFGDNEKDCPKQIKVLAERYGYKLPNSSTRAHCLDQIKSIDCDLFWSRYWDNCR